jgi:hypothetical protein
MKEEIRRVVEDEEEINYTKRMGDKWVDDLKQLKTDWCKLYITEAPYIVLLFKQTYGLNEDGSKKTHYYNEISCSVAAGEFNPKFNDSHFAKAWTHCILILPFFQVCSSRLRTTPAWPP